MLVHFSNTTVTQRIKLSAFYLSRVLYVQELNWMRNKIECSICGTPAPEPRSHKPWTNERSSSFMKARLSGRGSIHNTIIPNCILLMVSSFSITCLIVKNKHRFALVCCHQVSLVVASSCQARHSAFHDGREMSFPTSFFTQTASKQFKISDEKTFTP